MKPKLEHDMTNPITAAVLPLKGDAQNRAEKWARERIAKVLADMAAAGWDIDVAAPRASSTRHSREEYKRLNAKHAFYSALTTWTQPTRRPNEPNIRKQDDAAEARFIARARDDAAAQYDAFVFKMVGKIGAAETASLTGSHVWGESFLTVTKPDGSREVWKTQQILNVSALGTLFNQWPSRKVKR